MHNSLYTNRFSKTNVPTQGKGALSHLHIVCDDGIYNYDELEILQRANRCQLPFLYDPQGDMQKINQFPAEPAFQTFLLDSLNRVLLIGSPVENDKIWTLYQRSLSSSPL